MHIHKHLGASTPCLNESSVISVESNSVTLWAVALQTPQSMEFSLQVYWSGLPFLGKIVKIANVPETFPPIRPLGSFLCGKMLSNQLNFFNGTGLLRLSVSPWVCFGQWCYLGIHTFCWNFQMSKCHVKKYLLSLLNLWYAFFFIPNVYFCYCLFHLIKS